MPGLNVSPGRNNRFYKPTLYNGGYTWEESKAIQRNPGLIEGAKKQKAPTYKDPNNSLVNQAGGQNNNNSLASQIGGSYTPNNSLVNQAGGGYNRNNSLVGQVGGQNKGGLVGNASNDYINSLKKNPGMTLEQQQLLRNRIADTNASQRQGSEERLRSQMARSGLSGTGIETRGLLQNEMNNMSSLQNALTSQDLANMRMENDNRMKLAGLGIESANNLDKMGYNYNRLGENARQFDTQSAIQQQNFNKNFGWQKYQDDLNKFYYNNQQKDWKSWLEELMG